MRLHWNQLIWDKHGHAGGVSSLAWSPDGSMLATGSNDKTIEIRNPDPGKRQVVLEGHAGIVTGVTFSADSKLLASKSHDGTVRLWRCNNWEIAAILEEPNSDCWAAGLAFHPQTMTLATLAQERWVEKNLARDLQKAGINVVLDRWENARFGVSISRFIERIEKCDKIILVGTPLYRRKYENKDPSTGYVVAPLPLRHQAQAEISQRLSSRQLNHTRQP